MLAEKRNAIVFGGQGSQYVGMGKKAYDSYHRVKEVFAIASEITGFDVANLCFDANINGLNTPICSQICSLTLELAIHEVFKEQEIEITAAAGFSLGEYAALVATGVIEINAAIELVYRRATLVQKTISESLGMMVAVIGLNINRVQEVCELFDKELLAIANYNSYQQVVVSLTRDLFGAFSKEIRAIGGRVIPLSVSHPYHHPLMLPAANKYQKYLLKTNFQPPKYDLYMNVSGEQFLEEERCFAGLLYQHMIKPVQWITLINNMALDGVTCVYEISAKPVLAEFIKNISNDAISVVDVNQFI